MAKPLILVSNDDGITSKGIRTLVNVMKELGDVLVVAPNTDAAQGFALAEVIRLAIEKTPIEGCHPVTVSMGVSLVGMGESIENALGRADAALYRAKSNHNSSIELATADDAVTSADPRLF